MGHRGVPDPCIREHVAATSAGFVGDELMLDLAYIEDSKAEVDLNLVATRSGAIIEVQGTAEGAPIPRKDIDRLINTAAVGIHTLTDLQDKALSAAKVDLSTIFLPGGQNA